MKIKWQNTTGSLKIIHHQDDLYILTFHDRPVMPPHTLSVLNRYLWAEFLTKRNQPKTE